MSSNNNQFPEGIIHYVFRNLIVQSITIQKFDKKYPNLLKKMKELKKAMEQEFVFDLTELYRDSKFSEDEISIFLESLIVDNRFIDHAFNYYETEVLGISEDILHSHSISFERTIFLIQKRQSEFLEHITRVSELLVVENFLADTEREYYISDLLIDLPIDQLVYDYIYFQLLIEKYQHSESGEYQDELNDPIGMANLFKPLNRYLRFFSPKFTTSFVEYNAVKKGQLRYDYLSYNLRIDEPTENIADSMTTFFLQYIAHRVWFYHGVADVDDMQKGVKIEELQEINKILQSLDVRSNVEHGYEKKRSVQTDLVALWLYEINKEKKADKRIEMSALQFAQLEKVAPEKRPTKKQIFDKVDVLLQREKTDLKPLEFLHEISERLKNINDRCKYDLDIKFNVTEKALRDDSEKEIKVLLCSAYTPVSGNLERTKYIEFMIRNTTISSKYEGLLKKLEK